MSKTTSEGEAMDLTDGRVRAISMDLMVKRVKARLLYGDVTQDQKALVFEGEAGCGKTSILRQTFAEMGLHPISVTLGAQQMEELLAAGVKVVEDEDGNPKIMQAVHENLIPTENHVNSGQYTFDVNGNSRTVIPWFFDEIFTGNVGQMNQLRSALTLHQIGSVPVPPEATIFGTTNPESVEYSSRRSVDAAIMDRCEVIRVYLTFTEHQRYLTKLEADGKFPAVCRLFLRMEENKDLWNMASPRFWHQGFGCVWMELGSADFMTIDEKMELFEQALAGHWQEIANKSISSSTGRKKTAKPLSVSLCKTLLIWSLNKKNSATYKLTTSKICSNYQVSACQSSSSRRSITSASIHQCMRRSMDPFRVQRSSRTSPEPCSRMTRCCVDCVSRRTTTTNEETDMSTVLLCSCKAARYRDTVSYMQCKKNGVRLREEVKNADGTVSMCEGDVYECPRCGHQVIAGCGDFYSTPPSMADQLRPIIIRNPIGESDDGQSS